MSKRKTVVSPAPRRSREGQVLLGLLALIVLGVVVSTAVVLDRPPVPTPYPTSAALAALPDCDVPNLTWTVPGWLLRGGAPTAEALTCLAQSGVDVVVDQRLPAEDTLGEAALAAQAGLEYVNLGVPIDTAPDPNILAQWITTVEEHLDADQVVLVHDAGEGGRVGFWDAVYQMRHRMAAAEAVEKFYIGTGLPFEGADISCAAGGNGQVQALAEMTGHLVGTPYTPAVDEYGHAWGECARPAYMVEWKYPFSALSPEEN
jgi:hypothetical protein